MNLEPLEIAAGTVLEYGLGASRPAAERPSRTSPGAGRAALETLLLEAMAPGRMSLSFSGGRDSSLLLAVATDVARRHGHPDPVPITMRHPSPDSDESEFQTAVITHLGLTDWERVDVADSLDALGDIATAALRRHGLLAPPNAYLHARVLEVAPPGALVTGRGGDEVLGTTAWRLAGVLAGRRRPTVRDVGGLGFAMSPQSVRRAVTARQRADAFPWLRPDGEREVVRRLAAEQIGTRVRWDTGALLWARSRTNRLADHGLARIAETTSVRVMSPLADERFVKAFAGEMGLAGPRSREVATRHLAGGLLPEVVVRRSSKARFDQLIWGPRFRAFVDVWDPATLDPAVRNLVEPEHVRRLWREPSPRYQLLLLLQQAWLDQDAS